MICDPCREQKHDECKSPVDCPCQHRECDHLPDGTVTPKGVRRDVR